MQSIPIPIPPHLLSHPTQFPVLPPITTRLQSLPIDKLTWENFERLCLRVERLNAELETCRIYGTRGQNQEGIDVYSVLRLTGKYRVLQCKRVRRFSPTHFRSAVDLFLNGEWASTATCFTLCTSFRLESTKILAEIEEQRKRLRERSIALEIWDAAELDILLKAQAEIVDDFFGRPHAEMFCPPEALEALRNRITGPTVAELRTKLGSLYARVFVAHDPGLPVELGSKDPTPLRDRYVLPDIYEDRIDSRTMGTEKPQTKQSAAESSPVTAWDNTDLQPRAHTIDVPRQRRKLNDWLTDQTRQVLVGGPGLGKSALLRYVTLDLLSETPVLTHASAFHDTYLPIWLSFPFWTAHLEGSTAVLSLPDIVRSWLHLWSEDRLWPLFEQALNDERLLLLVDGLDEYRSEDSARSALTQLQVFAEQRNCRVIATARPTGYDRLGVQRTGWSATHLAELTLEQQKQYAVRWFTLQRRLPGEADSDPEMSRSVEAAAAAFIAETKSSADLSELSKTPLLLGLLLYLKSSSVPLPNSRFRAYGRLVEHLISVHPIARRRAAMVNGENPDLTPEDARTVFAYLAFHLQSQLSEGLIERLHADEVVSRFLQDDQMGFGLDRKEARRQSRVLLNFGEQSLGLLVEKGPEELGFLHRSFQEHLAAEHIARMPFTEQSEFVRQHCTDPAWREVLLSLFHLTKRPEEVAEFVRVINDRARSLADRFTRDTLLCEIAVGDFQCPVTLAKRICGDIVTEIESSPWLLHRQRLLRSLLLGLFSPKLRELIQDCIRLWIPGRPWRHSLALALADGSQSSDVVDCLFRLLLDEDDFMTSRAATSLVNLAGAHPEIAERLLRLLGEPYSVSTQVSALEALQRGWPNHPEWTRILPNIEQSPSVEHRLIAIRRKVDIGIQTTADRDQLLTWATARVGLRMSHGGSLTATLLKGWPGDVAIKNKALEAARPNSWGDEHMDLEIALVILAQGFTDDQDSRDAIASLIRDEHRNYLWMQHCTMLLERLKGIPTIIEAVDQWLLKNPPILTREVSFFVRIGWSETGKKRLLESLSQSFSFWSVEALLDHWGMADHEVSTALTELAQSPRAAEIAYLLPRIITEPESCRQRLMALLRDPNCGRPDFVLRGLVQLNQPEHNEEIVDAALPFAERESLWDSGLKDILLTHFADSAKVRGLAGRQVTLREGNLASVALSYGNDPDVRAKLIAAATPLPVSLRALVVSFLADYNGTLAWANDLLAQYDLEADPGIKTQMAISHYGHLLHSGQDLNEAKSRLLQEIVAGGPDHVERRQAAFCGLQVLSALNLILTTPAIYQPGHPHISLYDGLHTNYPLLEFLLANWAPIREALGEKFWETLSDYGRDEVSVWGTLCLLADNYPAPRMEALEFIRENRKVAIRPQFLEFVAKVQPRSALLRDLCLNSLFSTSNDHENDPEKAIELLARDFSDDAVVRESLEAKLQGEFHMHGHRAMWALCQLSPDNPILEQEMDQLRPHFTVNGDWVIQTSFDMALVCTAGTSQEVFSVIRFILRGCRPNYRYFAKGFYRPIVRRVALDVALQDMLRSELSNTPNPSERGSFLSLLLAARGLTVDLRDWCRAECDRKLDGIIDPLGMDIVTGLIRPVREFATTALLEGLAK